MPVNPIPTGYEAITPYIAIDGAAKAIEFYKKAFGATEIMNMPGPDGRVAHAELKIGGGIVMIGDECPQLDFRSPKAYGGTAVGLMFYVPDVDAVFARAVEAGAAVKKPVQDQFYGDRSGSIVDPFGHAWTIATHKEDLTPEEISARMEKMMAQQPA